MEIMSTVMAETLAALLEALELLTVKLLTSVCVFNNMNRCKNNYECPILCNHTDIKVLLCQQYKSDSVYEIYKCSYTVGLNDEGRKLSSVAG